MKIARLLPLLSALLLAPTAAPAADGPQDLTSLDLESLLNVRVTAASKFAQKVSDAPGVVVVVSRGELRRFGGLTLRQILERVPGLLGTSAYITDRSIVSARGDQTKINGGHVLILINGRPTREILEGGIISDLLESFPVAVLERIEVVKGPGSVLYGSNAFSAVINLVTQKAEDTHLVVTTLAGSIGAKAATAQASYRRGDLSVVGAAQYHQKPVWETQHQILDPFTGTYYNHNVTIPDRGPGAYLGVNYKGLSFMSSFTQWATEYFIPGMTGETRWQRGFADIGYAFTAKGKWDMTVNLTYTKTTFNALAPALNDRSSSEALLEWTSFVTLSPKDLLTVGALYDHIGGREIYFSTDPPVTGSQGYRSGGATYAQLEHQLREDLTVVGGVQLNKIAGIGLDAVPRAGVVWSPWLGLNFKALYGQAFRAPSINETHLNHQGLVGNPNLKPEKVATLDLEASYQGARMQVGFNYFRSRLTDGIVFDFNELPWKYTNLGGLDVHGFELAGKYYLRKSWLLLGSAMYQRNKASDGSNDIGPLPAFSAKAGVSYSPGNRFALSLFDVYQGSFWGYNNIPNPEPRRCHILSSNFHWDISKYLGVDERQGVALVAYADNITNRQVWLPNWGSLPDSMPVHRGRTVYFGLEFSLKKE
jgi:outer membrane receptor for ferrienterochelin and colicins